MTVVCGTDFSDASAAACHVAAELAARHHEPLTIVHALVPMAPAPGVPVAAGVLDEMVSSVRKSLTELAGSLAGSGPDVGIVVEIGEPDEVLLQCATEKNARLIVIGSVGRRGARWLLGSTADRLASRSPFPLLVTRPRFPAREWLQANEPLRVIVASDLGPSTTPAVAWAAHLPEHGPCAFIVAHLAWPPGEYDRLAIDGPMHLDRTHPVVEELLERDLAVAARSLHGVGETKIVVEPAMGRTSDSLTSIATREDADLVIVGRGRGDEQHWWEASTSRAVVRKAPMSVVVVPADTGEEPEIAVPRIQRVFAATDLSRAGNAALVYALALAPAGGSVRIVHVIDADDQDERQRRYREIESLVRSARLDPGVAVEIEILSGEDTARRITTESERFDADLVCIGSRGRSAIATVFGSISQEVLLRSERPVLVVQSVPAGRREVAPAPAGA
jgi:nucleotide-binding universal stress UspA family protein